MNLDTCNKCVYRVLCMREMLAPTLRCLLWGSEYNEVTDCDAFEEGDPLILRIERLEKKI